MNTIFAIFEGHFEMRFCDFNPDFENSKKIWKPVWFFFGGFWIFRVGLGNWGNGRLVPRFPCSPNTHIYAYALWVLIKALRAYKRCGRYYHAASACASRYSDLACCFVPRALALTLLADVAPVDTAHKPQ